MYLLYIFTSKSEFNGAYPYSKYKMILLIK